MKIQLNRRAKTDIPVWKWFLKSGMKRGKIIAQTPYQLVSIDKITSQKAFLYATYGGYHCFASRKGALKYIPPSMAERRRWVIKKLYIPKGALYHEGTVRNIKNYEIPCLGAKELRFKKDLKR